MFNAPLYADKVTPVIGKETIKAEQQGLKLLKPGIKIKTVKYEDGSVYIGECVKKVRQGYGYMFYPSGEVYRGDWSNDLRAGQGSMTFSNGGKYEGEWQEGAINGQGTMVFASGGKYEGEWKNGRIDGSGTMTFANGDVYRGECRDNKIDGEGVMSFANGEMYEGQWKAGKKHGTGAMTFLSGDRYEGQWDEGRIEGFGTMAYADSSRYAGFWSGGIRSGNGSFTYPDGQKWEGEWKDGLMVAGFGVKELEDGVTEQGEWKDGCFWNGVRRQTAREDLVREEKVKGGEVAGVLFIFAGEAIREDGFAGDEAITSLLLPEAVKTVPAAAFRGCSKLSELEMKGVQTLGAQAFEGTALESVTIPETVSAIYADSFKDAPLKSVFFAGPAPKVESSDSVVVLCLPEDVIVYVMPEHRESYSFEPWTGMQLLAPGAETEYALNISEESPLQALISDEVAGNARRLAVSGPIVEADLEYLLKCRYLRSLDLSGCQYVKPEVPEAAEARSAEPAGDDWTLSEESFAPLAFLKELILPKAAEEEPAL